MHGHYSISDLTGRTYWLTSDLRDAYETAIELGASVDLLVVTDERNGRTVYVKNGRVSIYVMPDGRDVDRPRRAA